jgi:nitrogen fixation protein
MDVLRKLGKRFGLSYPTVWRLHQKWKDEQAHIAAQSQIGIAFPVNSTKSISENKTANFDAEQKSVDADALPSNGPGDEAFSDNENVAAAQVRSGKMVRHAGGLLLVALIASFGLYEAALKGWDASVRWRDRLRMAIDAVILSLGIGQRCVEGVRRLETSTAPILLRCNQAPSESWVRRIIKRYVEGTGMANKLHLRMTGAYLESARSTKDAPAVFYVDNHMRPYTGKFTLRKGWRMQDKRVKPGVTDYYVHDEDGRPVCRVEAPGHDSLTDWLSPIAQLLRGGLEEGQRVLLAFDRAGAFPVQMAKLRDTSVEFVTYERKPYKRLPKSAFTERVTLEDGEVFLVHEKRLANLGNGRGRVRRIALLTEEGHQVNLLAVSKEPAWRLIEIITGRWVQENGFKHGNERWGFNQLDRRKLVNYDPDTIIPNPARRRLELSLKIAREHEGTLRRKLARLEADSPGRTVLEAELQESLSRQIELEAQRPHLPTHAPLEETELAGELAYHDPHYKTVIDTIRIACANAESELALELAEHLRKPAEAKKILANLFDSTGNIRVSSKSITIALYLTGRKDERQAIDQLFQKINGWKLTLPGDPQNRSLRFKSQI